MVHSFRIFLIFFAVIVMVQNVAFAKNITVKKNGGGMYTTIQAAVNSASKGDIIEIQDSNTYNETINTSNGQSGTAWTAGNYYTLKTQTGMAPVISGGLTLNGDYWRIEGIRFTGSGAMHGSQLFPSGSHYQIVGCTFSGSNSPEGFILIYGGGAYTEIDSCKFSGNSTGYGVQVSDTNSSNVIIHDSEFSGQDIAVSFKRSDTGTIYNNYISNLAGFRWAFYIRDSQNIVFRSNIVYKVDQAWHMFNHGGEPSTGHEFYNNIIDACGYGIVWQYGGTNFKVKNNIFINNGTALELGGSGNIYDYNIFFNNNKNTNKSGAVDGGQNKVQNPNIVASGNRPLPYYSLAQNNPSGDNGINDDSDIPAFDFTGSSRNGQQWIGAFEYGGGNDTGGNISPPTGLRVVQASP